MTITPLYNITYHNKQILFIHIGIVGSIVSHYHVILDKPENKFVELNKMAEDFNFFNNIDSYTQSL